MYIIYILLHLVAAIKLLIKLFKFLLDIWIFTSHRHYLDVY